MQLLHASDPVVAVLGSFPTQRCHLRALLMARLHLPISRGEGQRALPRPASSRNNVAELRRKKQAGEERPARTALHATAGTERRGM